MSAADPFSLEAQLERIRQGMRPESARARVAAKIGQRYATELERLGKLEAKMRRAFNAWDKQRAVVRRLERKLDALQWDEQQAEETQA